MAEMTSKDRVLKTLNHQAADRVPLYTLGMDPIFINEFGGGSPYKALQALDVDIFPIRSMAWCQGRPQFASLREELPPEMLLSGGFFGGWDGVDEFGRIWKQGSYMGGVVKTEEDIEKYVPPLKLEERTDPHQARGVMERYGDRAFALSSHTGPFGMAMESMGQVEFCLAFVDQRELIRKHLRARTDWFIGIAKYAEELGVDLIMMGDDVAYKERTFISTEDFDELVIPEYRRICQSVDIPVIWHSDGYITPLLDGAVRAGFAGVHALEPAAGVDLGQVKSDYGDKLILMGNVDVTDVLCQEDLEVVRRDVDRCMSQAKTGGGFVLSDSNSIHAACKAQAVREMFRYGKEAGRY
jgi:uroporphyrinogen decarboxylase